MIELKPKPSFETFVSTCTHFYRVSELEASMKLRIQSIVNNLLNFEPSNDPVVNLRQFLQRDEDFLGVVLAMVNLSQEKLLRVISAKRFTQGDYGSEWNIDSLYSRIKRDDVFAEEIARLFLEGPKNVYLSSQITDFYLDQLSLPEGWSKIIRDQNVIGNIVRKKLAGEYTNLKGMYVEELIKSKIDQIAHLYGFTYQKGQCHVFNLGKEIDIAIPSLNDPFILIMVSYMETTSSGQTARANEQKDMYLKIIGENLRYSSERIFINFTDGTGWLSRRSDLRKLYNSCHYIININTVEQIQPIILKYLPKQFFSLQPPSNKD